jgi:hypothetical protein
MKLIILIVAVIGLSVFIIVAARLCERRVRSGPPVHPEFKDAWRGDDTDDRDDG